MFSEAPRNTILSEGEHKTVGNENSWNVTLIPKVHAFVVFPLGRRLICDNSTLLKK